MRISSSLKKARQLHALLLTSSTPFTYHKPFLHNNIISIYSKCGSLFHSHLVFDKMPHRNAISYNSILAAHARHPTPSSAFGLFAQMRHEGFHPNGSTFTSLLQSASGIGHCFLGLALHSLIIKSGLLFDLYVQTALIGFYSHFRDLESVNQVFETILVKDDDIVWNSIMSGNLKNNRLREGLCLFKRMLRSRVIPSKVTYSIVLNACARLGHRDCGRLTHGHVLATSVRVDLPLQNALVDMYSSCGDTQSAFRVFNAIPNPDIVSWNSMLAGYAEKGEGDEAIHLFVRLQNQSPYKPDEYTFTAVVSAVQQYPASHYGEPLHARVIVAGLDKSEFVGSPLISMYFKNGRGECAERAFLSVPNKDVVLWTEMIAGYSKTVDGEKSVKFFYNMWKEGHKIDGFALSSALSACADLAIVNQSEVLHSQAIKTGYDSEMSVCGSLIDTYAKNGNLHAAESIFAEVADPDLKCWNSMIGGYSHHGKAEEAIKLFDEILAHGLEPDEVTYISLLSACSHCGLVEKGKYWWNYMKAKGLTPGIKHYSCMVSLLSRAGLLEEAVEIINESCFSENHVELWRTVLTSSVSSKNLLMGLQATRKILQYNAEDSATHSLLSNLYASVGRWDGVMEIRKRIRGMMMEKDPGLSWVENAKSLDVFSSGDQLHPRIQEVKAELHALQGNMMLLCQDVVDDI